MKQHVAAIAFNEKELESYVSQLLSGGFETVSEVKKSDDGTFYQALARRMGQEAKPSAALLSAEENASPQA